jgi:transposase
MSGDNFSRRYAIVAETRRRWSDAEKQAIIAEAARPDANISAVARRHGIKPSLLFGWRRMAREAQAHTSRAVFVPVTLALPPASAAASSPETAPRSRSDVLSCPSADTARTDDRIEIELGNGRLVRVGSGVDMGALKRILNVLDSR